MRTYYRIFDENISGLDTEAVAVIENLILKIEVRLMKTYVLNGYAPVVVASMKECLTVISLPCKTTFQAIGLRDLK